MLITLRKILAALITKKDSRIFKTLKEIPAYFKPEHMRVKLENAGLVLTLLSCIKTLYFYQHMDER